MNPESTSEELAAISALALERRNRATQKLEEELPSVIKDVLQAEVAYTFDPRWFPLPYVDVESFIASLSDAFGLSLTPPDIGPLANTLAREELLTLTSVQAVEGLFRSYKGVTRFNNGRFSKGRDEFDPITSVRITPEQILVAVQGRGDVAELVVAETVELLWACAGAPKRWEAIRPKVQLIGYATSTLLELNFPFESFLSPTVVSFMSDNVVDGERYGDHIGDYLAQDDFKPPPGSMLTWGAEKVELRLFRFDMRNGRQVESALRFTVTTRSDYGTGRVIASSEMPFDKHVACVADLAESLRKVGSTRSKS